MGLSRRRFTKELKLAAVQRLEMGVSIPHGITSPWDKPAETHRRHVSANHN